MAIAIMCLLFAVIELALMGALWFGGGFLLGLLLKPVAGEAIANVLYSMFGANSYTADTVPLALGIIAVFAGAVYVVTMLYNTPEVSLGTDIRKGSYTK